MDMSVWGQDTDEFLGRTFVNGRGRDVIMVEMRQRIDRGDYEREVQEAIQVGTRLPSISFHDLVGGEMRRTNQGRWDRPCVISQRTERGSWRWTRRRFDGRSR